VSQRGRGHCVTCDRIFALTYVGTIPLHWVAGRGSDRCEGSNQAPKPGSETTR
jgi:hypothetical protein